MNDYVDRIEILKNLYEINRMKKSLDSNSQVKDFYSKTIASLWKEYHNKTNMSLLEKDLKTLKQMEINCQRTNQFSKIKDIKLQVQFNKVLLKNIVLNKQIVKANQKLSKNNQELLKFTIVEQNLKLGLLLGEFEWLKTAELNLNSYVIVVKLNNNITICISRGATGEHRISLRSSLRSLLLKENEAQSLLLESNIKESELIKLGDNCLKIDFFTHNSIHSSLNTRTIKYNREEYLRIKDILKY